MTCWLSGFQACSLALIIDSGLLVHPEQSFKRKRPSHEHFSHSMDWTALARCDISMVTERKSMTLHEAFSTLSPFMWKYNPLSKSYSSRER